MNWTSQLIMSVFGEKKLLLTDGVIKFQCRCSVCTGQSSKTLSILDRWQPLCFERLPCQRLWTGGYGQSCQRTSVKDVIYSLYKVFASVVHAAHAVHTITSTVGVYATTGWMAINLSLAAHVFSEQQLTILWLPLFSVCLMIVETSSFCICTTLQRFSFALPSPPLSPFLSPLLSPFLSPPLCVLSVG